MRSCIWASRCIHCVLFTAAVAGLPCDLPAAMVPHGSFHLGTLVERRSEARQKTSIGVCTMIKSHVLGWISLDCTFLWFQDLWRSHSPSLRDHYYRTNNGHQRRDSLVQIADPSLYSIPKPETCRVGSLVSDTQHTATREIM